MEEGRETIPAQVITGDGVHPLTLHIKGLTADEKQIILDGCLINFYAATGSKEVNTMEKIVMQNKIVEMDGDEMTRIPLANDQG